MVLSREEEEVLVLLVTAVQTTKRVIARRMVDAIRLWTVVKVLLVVDWLMVSTVVYTERCSDGYESIYSLYFRK